MTAEIDELRADEITNGCTETRDAVSRCCHFFHESGRFNPIPSYHKIGTIFNLDAKTVWTHWDMFHRLDLEDRQAGRPPYRSSEHMETVIAYAFAQFHAREPATLTRLVLFILEQ
jgi:hypothetical protein